MLEWLSNLLIVISPLRARTSHPAAPLAKTLARYEESLQALSETPKSQVDVLLARNQVDHTIRRELSISVDVIQRIEQLDQQLRSKAGLFSAENLALWREIIHPDEKAWWWVIDKQSAEKDKQNNLPWEIASGTLLVLTTPLLLDIIKRLWNGAPDAVSVLGTLLTLLLTASPLVKQGRQIATALFQSVIKLRPERQPRVMAWMSLTAFLLMLFLQQWVLPYPLATYYNNRGIVAHVKGNIQDATELFQRAAALNPDRVVPYYNLAEAYQQIGFSKQAQGWYEKAIERDSNFAPAYQGLGQVYNENGDFIAAERILTAGLQAVFTSDEVTMKVTKYGLLSHLGWSYFGQNKLDLAQEVLLDALALEPDLKILGDSQGVEYRLALPHFYLAQIYELAGDVENAKLQWEECMRFLDAGDLRQKERVLIAQQHLNMLETK